MAGICVGVTVRKLRAIQKVTAKTRWLEGFRRKPLCVTSLVTGSARNVMKQSYSSWLGAEVARTFKIDAKF